MKGSLRYIVSLLVVPLFASATGQAWADNKKPDPVTIVNTPLPVTGTLGVSGQVQAQINNGVGNPVPVKITGTNPPVRFQSEKLMTVAQGTTGNSVAMFQVPLGMVGIVKFVSGHTFTNVDSWVSCAIVRTDANGTPLGGNGEHVVQMQKQLRPGVGDFYHEFSQPMEFYVDNSVVGFNYVGVSCDLVPAPTSFGDIFQFDITGILESAQ